MYLIIDCETTGLPKNWKAPATDIDNWPRVIQLAWALYDAFNRPIETEIHLIRPDGFAIPEEAQRIHHITTEQALAKGKPLTEVLHALAEAAAKAKILIAHNVKFDERVISAEYLRLKLSVPFSDKKRICTMENSTNFCQIPGQYGYKWPTLSQLHRKLFGSDVEEAHDAGADVAACARCFFELKNLRVITI
jgi:DNA polymerase III epsilon subunit-like protein